MQQSRSSEPEPIGIHDEIAALRSLEDVRAFVREGYRASGSPNSRWNRGHVLEFGFEYGKLPLAVAEPGPLIEQAVRVAGPDGLTLQQLRALFDRLGAERFERGLAFARGAGRIDESRERRRNRADRLQEQVVLRASPLGGGAE